MERTRFEYDVITQEPATLAPPEVSGAVEEDYISVSDAAEQRNTDLQQPTAAAAVSEGSEAALASTSGRQQLPWSLASSRIESPSVRLHTEIVEFCRFLEPTKQERAQRLDAINRITELVNSIFPAAEVKVFGSFVTGLYLPTSDVDLVVLHSRCGEVVRALRAIQQLLVRTGQGKNIHVVAKAKVPIVKFEDVATGFAFDISFDTDNGPSAAQYVLGLLGDLPPMRHLVIVLKLFLQQRELNEVYQGGIGSYALLVLVATMLLTHPSREVDDGGDGNLGLLLIDFFHLYARDLDADRVAISCRDGGLFFSKAKRSEFLNGRPTVSIGIEDPRDTCNDLGRGSFNFPRVQRAFDFAYQQLSAPALPSESLLQRIIRLDDVIVGRSAVAAAAGDSSDMDLDLSSPRARPSSHAKHSPHSKPSPRPQSEKPQKAVIINGKLKKSGKKTDKRDRVQDTLSAKRGVEKANGSAKQHRSRSNSRPRERDLEFEKYERSE